MKTRKSILAEASRLISEDRHQQHGDAKKTFANIAKGWEVIFGVEIPAYKVGLAFDWAKTVRTEASPKEPDNYVDGCGYKALAGELAADEEDKQ